MESKVHGTCRCKTGDSQMEPGCLLNNNDASKKNPVQLTFYHHSLQRFAGHPTNGIGNIQAGQYNDTHCDHGYTRHIHAPTAAVSNDLRT